jgi:hypothetical protein
MGRNAHGDGSRRLIRPFGDSICEEIRATLIRRRVGHDPIIERQILGYGAFNILRQKKSRVDLMLGRNPDPGNESTARRVARLDAGARIVARLTRGLGASKRNEAAVKARRRPRKAVSGARGFQPVCVPSGTCSSISRTPPRSLPSASGAGTRVSKGGPCTGGT